MNVMQRSLGGVSFAAILLSGFFYESVTDGITAHSGGGQASAVPLTTEINRITTVAALGDSVLLPLSVAGLTIIVINHGANPCQVFGAGTDTVDDVATATGVSQMQGSVTIYSCTTAGAWYSNGIGTGYAGSFPTVGSANGLSTTGTTQAGATPITTSINRFTTVGVANGAAVLPPSVAGMEIAVSNAAGTNSMNLFPSAGGTGTETINALGANAALAIPAGKTAFLICPVAGQWHCQAPS
jgi:hypothetical protein